MDRSSPNSHQNRSAASDDVLRAIRSGDAAAFVAVVEKLGGPTDSADGSGVSAR